MKTLFCVILAALAVLGGCAPRRDAAEKAQTAAVADYGATGVLDRPLEDIAAALAQGETSSVALTHAYLQRIEQIDRAGPKLQSVLAINPDALEQAKASDARRASKTALGPLDGVPILIKDNIETADPMPTTAGSLALKDNVTRRDSPLVASLRAGGVVILGKTNLTEWANFRSDHSLSGWSALGGQTKNAHILNRNPCGSSSGSAVAAAAALAAGAVGTETNGSISCPSSVNGIVGFKPTVGRVSQQHIVPISTSQDTAGPMTTTVKGAALLLREMTGGAVDSAPLLEENALQGRRVGVARFAQGTNPNIVALFDAALDDIEAAGAVLVEIKEFETPDDFRDDAYSVLLHEFKAGVSAYLAEAAPQVEARTLDALIAFNITHADEELALFGQDIFEEAAKRGDLASPEYVAARDAVQKAARRDGIDHLLALHRVDLVVAPTAPLAPLVDSINGDIWPEWVGIGYLPAVAGYPHLTVPMGAVRGAPIGLSFIGARDSDAAILSYGYAYEQKSRKRVGATYLRTAEGLPEIAAAFGAKAP